MSWINRVHEKEFLQENEPQKPQNVKEMPRKSPASNA